MCTKKYIVPLLVAVILALIPLLTASANAAPPPATVWFTFEYAIPQQPSVEDVALMLCENEDCSSYTVVDQTTEDWFGTDCAENWCRFQYFSGIAAYSATEAEPINFRLRIKFSDMERISNVAGQLPARDGNQVAYHVVVYAEDMKITTSDIFPELGLYNKEISFFLTVLLEPLVLAGVLAIWLKPKFLAGLLYWGLALLINFVSYPTLWTYFSALTRYHRKGDEGIGGVFFLAGLIFPLLFVLILNARRKWWRIIWIAITVLLVPFACFYFSVAALAGGYYYNEIIMEGLSFQNAILLLEASAVVYEGLLFYGLNRRKVPFLAAMIGSLAMNLVSFLVGLLFYNPWV